MDAKDSHFRYGPVDSLIADFNQQSTWLAYGPIGMVLIPNIWQDVFGNLSLTCRRYRPRGLYKLSYLSGLHRKSTHCKMESTRSLSSSGSSVMPLNLFYTFVPVQLAFPKLLAVAASYSLRAIGNHTKVESTKTFHRISLRLPVQDLLIIVQAY